MRQLTCVDLFAGCGGLSLGLHASGWDGLLAIERDPMAFDTLQANLVADSAAYPGFAKWPGWLPRSAHDINELVATPEFRDRLAEHRGAVQLVAGGPPCQGFSVGGARNGTDERNELVHRQLDIVGILQPELTMVENVEGITRPFMSRPGAHGAISVADAVVEELSKLGYDAAYGVVDASRYGVPQMRRRAVIFGVRRDVGVDPSLLFTKLADQRSDLLAAWGLDDVPITARDALDDLWGPQPRVVCPDSQKYQSIPYRDATSGYARLMRRGLPTGCVPDSHRFTVHGERIIKLYEEAHRTQPRGRLSKEFLLANGTKKDKKVLIDPDRPVSTITTHPDEFIHYGEPRNVTVREMARLQSFPDDFRFRGRYTINGPRRRFDVARCSQVGNAVPPHLGQALGTAMAALLGP